MRQALSPSVGPVRVSLPIFDGGRRRADLQAARVAYDASVTRYQASVRTAATTYYQNQR